MRSNIHLLFALVIGVFLAFAICGCTERKQERPEPIDDPMITMYELTETPATSAYEHKGRELIRETKLFSFMAIMKPSAIEGLQSQKALEVNESKMPGVNLEPGKAVSTEADTGQATSGGFKVTLWDTIKRFIKGIFSGLIGIGVLCLILYIIPVTRPLIVIAFKALGTLFSWLVPILGGLLEKLKAKKVERQRDELIDGGQAFQDYLYASQTPEEASKMWTLYKQAQMSKQNKDTQEFVTKYKE